MEITKTTTKFPYRIEPSPEGGFIARPSDPAMETIEGGTREDVQQKIQAKIKQVMGDQFTREFNFAGVNVAVAGKVSVKSHNNSGLALITPKEEPLPKNDMFISASTPIVPSDNGRTVLRLIAALVALAVFAWWLLHR